MRITSTAPTWYQIKALYRDAPWAATWRDVRLRNAVGHSTCLWAMQGAALIGVVRFITDGATVTYVCDLIVKETCRHRGVGTKLIEAMLKHQSVRGTSIVVLTQAGGFYERFDFVPRSAWARRHR